MLKPLLPFFLWKVIQFYLVSLVPLSDLLLDSLAFEVLLVLDFHLLIALETHCSERGVFSEMDHPLVEIELKNRFTCFFYVVEKHIFNALY